MEQNIKFDNNDLLNFSTLLPKGEKGDIGHQSTQDFATTSTNPIDHNALWQEVAEPIPAKLIPEDQNPQQNNYLGADFNYGDTRNQLYVANKFISHLPMLKNSEVALSFQMDKRTNISFPRVFKWPRKGKWILELLEWTKKWWKLAVWNSQWP